MANFNTSDLEFILTQIKMAETGTPPLSPHLAFGLREVAGTNNSAVTAQGTFGSADQTFPTATQQYFRTVTVNVDGTPFDPNPGVAGDVQTTSYASTIPGAPQAFGVNVIDPGPRLISNAISDISANNPAAVLTAQAFGAQLGDGYTVMNTNPTGLTLTLGVDGIAGTADDFWGADGVANTIDDVNTANLFIGNITPDAGLSAPFNNWLTFFGQFFDHGVDLITKGGNGTVFIPLAADDPLRTVGPDGIVDGSIRPDGSIAPTDAVPASQAFMILTRATNLPGADGILGTADDLHQNTNTITPFVDQSQTYTSNPAHQAFLREYITGIDGKLHSTGKLLQHAAGPDNIAGNADDNTGMATWSDVKANALKLGIVLTDYNVGNVPLVATDAYGNLLLSANGNVQIVVSAAGGGQALVEAGNINAANGPITALALPANTIFTDHAFLNDTAFMAVPFAQNGVTHLVADSDTVAGNAQPISASGDKTTYDNELLDAHYIAGDGRANENIALTAVHTIFHDEHNRLLDQTKGLIQQELSNGNVSFANNWVLAGVDLTVANGVDANGVPVHVIQANEWNGERLFQTAKFGTETQYQHLVFEEFARKIAPTIHVFGNVDIHLDPAIVSEFANAVYRFGHSMLDENVPTFQLNADGTYAVGADGKPIVTNMGLIQAFTNPLAFAAGGATEAAQIIQGTTHQIGSEIDEFVTGSLRNNLLGLPLDLAALNIARGRDVGVAPLNLVRAQMYDATHDQTLKPYANWDEFRQFLKHDASIMNFLAAYGTHASITGAATLADKRAAALNLVTLGTDPAHQADDAAHQDAYNFLHSLGAYANDTGNVLAVHAQWSTGSITGLDNIDLWIGGLAEKQNLFGGLLGSTFNAIFETQLEHLQDADRLYYLPRIEGTHWGGEIEANTFTDLIMRNTGAKHLPGSIFLTPEYTVEAKDYVNPDGTLTDKATWLHNPVTGALLVEVLPDNTVHFIGDDNFFGNTMVLGGTEGDDRLQAGHADDDTVWGDGGNDWIDGGNGNDQLFGGTGDDTIVDSAGDDIIHGDAGNDTILAGIGDDIIFGGDGDDYIETGPSGPAGIESAIGGLGNDIIIGGDGGDELEGNEGDDWLEGGESGDLLVGDQGAPTGQVPLIQGNDVLDGGANGDRMQGFSGDDIMLGLGGFDKFEGRSGFDWASWENELHGVDVDMNRREFIPNPGTPVGDAVRDFFIQTEAASGSKFDDFILGTNDSKADPFNNLTNVSLITGLADYFDPLAGPVNFSGGNILLGGGGSDTITGGGGNDIIDGDTRLHVELSDGHHAGSQIIREILDDQNVGPTFDANGVQLTAGNIDTAVYNDVSTNYVISIALDGAGNPRLDSSGNFVIQVSPVAGAALAVADGTDLLFNMERVQFTDTTIDLNAFTGGLIPFTDAAPTGLLSLIDNGNPIAAAAVVNVGDVLTFSSTLVDVDGVKSDPGLAFGDVIPAGDLHLQWQAFDIAGKDWHNVAGATSASFTPTDFLLGQQLRLQVSYVDGLGFTEVVHSAATAVLTFPAAPPVNHAPTLRPQIGAPGLADTAAREDTPVGTVAQPWIPLDLINTFTDDTTPANLLVYTATLADGSSLANAGLSFVTVPDPAIPGAILGGRIVGTPLPNFSGVISVRVTATDAGGLSVQDTFNINVTPVKDGVAPLAIVDLNGNPVTQSAVGNVLTAQLGVDPDNFINAAGVAVTAGPATFTWLRDGALIAFQNKATYTATLADVGKTITVKASYVDASGTHDVSTSVNGDFIVDPFTPAPPHVVALTANITEDAAALSQNLLAGAFDANGDPISVVTPDATIAGSNPDGGARVLGTGDFTVSPSGVFDLTASGLAMFNTLGQGVVETFTFHFAVSDGTGVAGNPVANTLTIKVTGTNDAPVVTGAITRAATEGGVAVSADALSNAADVDLGDHLTVVPPGALPAGVTYNALTHTFSFDPTNPAYNGLRQGQVQAVTVNYGVTDGHIVTPVADAITFNVTGTNDAPTDIVVTANAAAVGNNAAPGLNATIANLAAVDPDIGDPHTFALLAGSSAGFAVSSAGVITETANGLANNTTFTLNLQTSDGIAALNETITVQTGSNGNNNGAGSLNGSANTDIIYARGGNDTVNGNAGDDTLFGQDGNDILTGGTGSDTLYGGGGNNNFVATVGMGSDTIVGFQDGPDRLAVNSLGITAANFAANVTAGNIVIASNGAGGTLVTFAGQGSFNIANTAPGNITQADFNFAPTGLSLAHNQYKVTENAAGAKIDDVIVHDDAGDTHTFVVSDNRFEVINTAADGLPEALVLKLKDGVSLDYEAAKTVALDVSVFDSAGQASLLNPYHFTLQVQNVNEAPTNITPVTSSVTENAADGSLVATLSAIDPEGNSITYKLADSADGRFTIAGNQLRVAHSQLLDYESNTSHTVNVIATDSGGLQSMQTINVGVLNQAEAATQTGGAGFDLLNGTAGDDRLAGAGGGDFLMGNNGNDVLDGGTGGDFMMGGAGNDTYIVDSASDSISDTSGIDTVITSLSNYTLDVSIENLINSGSAASFTGTGNSSANIMRGGAFADTMNGGDGNDLLIGGAGNDVLNGGNQNDDLYGGIGGDTLSGGAGIDHITGGAGNDTMSGGTGNDVFTFAAGFGNDRITDFDAGPPGGQDLLDISQFGITAATFAAHVTITDVGADTLITIDNITQKILLAGINDASTITKSDFVLFSG